MGLKLRVKTFAKKYKIFRKLWHFYQSLIFKIKHPISKYYKKNRKGVVVQLVSTFSEKDAIGNSIIEISKGLKNKKIDNYIVYEGSHSKIKNGVPVSNFRFNEKDILIYHMAIGCYASDIYKKIKVKKKIMYYHNITPSKYFFDMPNDKKATELGRKQLVDLKDCTDLALCVSKFNENELKEIGYYNTAVVGIPNRVNELLKYKVNKTKDDITKIITVGRIARHKCVDDIIKVFNEYHKLNSKSHLYIVGACTNLIYENELLSLINNLNLKNNITITGPITDEKLGYYYSNADVYICMSEHEGFCVPLVEAMAFNVPIFAYGSSAIPETLENVGKCFYTKDYKEISQIIVNYELSYKEKIKSQNRFCCFDNEKTLNNIICLILNNF